LADIGDRHARRWRWRSGAKNAAIAAQENDRQVARENVEHAERLAKANSEEAWVECWKLIETLSLRLHTPIETILNFRRGTEPEEDAYVEITMLAFLADPIEIFEIGELIPLLGPKYRIAAVRIRSSAVAFLEVNKRLAAVSDARRGQLRMLSGAVADAGMLFRRAISRASD
jgi:hypothetical protein